MNIQMNEPHDIGIYDSVHIRTLKNLILFDGVLNCDKVANLNDKLKGD
jgi:hypothetical protein